MLNSDEGVRYFGGIEIWLFENLVHYLELFTKPHRLVRILSLMKSRVQFIAALLQIWFRHFGQSSSILLIRY